MNFLLLFVFHFFNNVDVKDHDLCALPIVLYIINFGA